MVLRERQEERARWKEKAKKEGRRPRRGRFEERHIEPWAMGGL